VKKHLLTCCVMPLFLPALVFGQHFDVELGYDSTSGPTMLLIEAPLLTSENIPYFESEMEELDPFNPGDFSSDEPGFATNAGEGLLLNSSDQIWLETLDASLFSAFGVGYVNYYDPVTDSLQAFGRIAIQDNSVSTADLILNGSSIEAGANPQFIDIADGAGNIHDHIIWDLLDDGTSPLGAYGIMFRLQSDFAPADGAMDLDSRDFWVIWNHGMTENDFETRALPAYGVGAVPEPGSAVLLGVASMALLLRRRRREMIA
jgi:hypothetical protein